MNLHIIAKVRYPGHGKCAFVILRVRLYSHIYTSTHVDNHDEAWGYNYPVTNRIQFLAPQEDSRLNHSSGDEKTSFVRSFTRSVLKAIISNVRMKN